MSTDEPEEIEDGDRGWGVSGVVAGQSVVFFWLARLIRCRVRPWFEIERCRFGFPLSGRVLTGWTAALQLLD